jgi:ribosomal protein S27AE
MPRKQKINLEKVLASLNAHCPKCGCTITPDKIRRVDFDYIVCPECGQRFMKQGKGTDLGITS